MAAYPVGDFIMSHGQFWRVVKHAWQIHGQQLQARRQRRQIRAFQRMLARHRLRRVRPAWLAYLPRAATMRLFHRS